MIKVVRFFVAFDNTPGWKKDADGHLILDAGGNPIYIGGDGKEMAVATDTIGRLNGEAKGFRIRAEEAEGKLKAYSVDGKLLDPSTVIKAIDTVGKIDAKKLIDAGEVDKVREQISAQFTAQLTEKDAALAKRTDDLNSLRISNIFTASNFVRDRIAVPPDMFRDSFGKHFKIEDDEIRAYDRSGNRLLSTKKAGEYATPDEALELLVEAHPQKDTILKAAPAGGSGNGGGGGSRPGGRVITRSDFEKLPPNEQAKVATGGEIKIVD